MRTGDALLTAMRALARGYRSDQVYRVAVGDRSFTVATNGHVMLAVPSVLCPASDAVPPDAVRNITVEQCQREQVTDGIDAATLATFAGVRSEPQPPCGQCHGKGEVPCTDCDGNGEEECECRCGHVHEAVCDECDGDGTVDCPACTPAKMQPARLCGHIINRALVRTVIEAVGVSDGRVAVQVVEKGGGAIFRFAPVDGEWFALVMSMRPDTRTAVDFDKPETWQKDAA